MAPTNATSGYDRMEKVKKFDESNMGVKGLLDSGITSIPHFFVHSPKILADLKRSPSQTSITIPIINLSNLISPTHRAQIISQVKEAASTGGFFQVINHGILQSTSDSTIKAIKSFHEQPSEVKSKNYKCQEHSGVMFTSINDLYRAKAASWHDSLQAWMGPAPVNPEYIPEICQKEVVTSDKCTKVVAEEVMELLSRVRDREVQGVDI